jgi:ABC-type branched-subunit amino acid transport system ATPase component
VAENLFVADRDSRDGLFKGALSRQRLDAYKSHLVDLFPVLVEKIDDPVMLLSGGEIQLCALAVALMAKPKILLLDEFVSALSEENEQRAIHALSLFNSSPRNGSCAILIVSHERLILEKLGATIVTLDRHRSEEE